MVLPVEVDRGNTGRATMTVFGKLVSVSVVSGATVNVVSCYGRESRVFAMIVENSIDRRFTGSDALPCCDVLAALDTQADLDAINAELGSVEWLVA